MLHYSRLAEKHGIEVLCIGTELYRTAVEREQDWRRLIADIRRIYDGKLIYAANWYREFEVPPNSAYIFNGAEPDTVAPEL